MELIVVGDSISKIKMQFQLKCFHFQYNQTTPIQRNILEQGEHISIKSEWEGSDQDFPSISPW